MDKRKNNGGHKTNGGRPTKVDELKVNELFNKALRVLYKQDTDDDNKIKFVVDLLESQRGQIFVAEHIFGKPKETIEQTTNFNTENIKELFKIDTSKS